jgi:ribosome biogenesis GTPase A
MSKHAKVGARSYSQVRSPEIILATLVKEFPLKFDDFYNLESNGDAEILIEKLGRKKGFLKKNNEVDEDKTARFILKNWQEGKIK